MSKEFKQRVLIRIKGTLANINYELKDYQYPKQGQWLDLKEYQKLLDKKQYWLVRRNQLSSELKGRK